MKLSDVACLLGVGEGVCAAIVGDGDVALLNVNVGRPVLSHRAQLHQVAVRLELLHSNSNLEMPRSAEDVSGMQPMDLPPNRCISHSHYEDAIEDAFQPCHIHVPLLLDAGPSLRSW